MAHINDASISVAALAVGRTLVVAVSAVAQVCVFIAGTLGALLIC